MYISSCIKSDHRQPTHMHISEPLSITCFSIKEGREVKGPNGQFAYNQSCKKCPPPLSPTISAAKIRAIWWSSHDSRMP